MSLAGSRLTRQSRAGDGDVVDECGSSPNVATTVVECQFFLAGCYSFEPNALAC
jgi:hypothetical protein